MAGERVLRIAYIINSLEGGGAISLVPAIADVIRAAGHEIEIFALARKDGRGHAVLSDAGLTVHVCDRGITDHIGTFLWLNREISLYRPTHLWTSLTRATLLGQQIGRNQRIPVVSWQHNAWLKPGNRLLLRATQRLSFLWLGDSEHVTALSAQRLGIPAERLINWPVFTANPDAPQARPWQPGEPVRIGSLGRLHRGKGYDVLIDALIRLRDAGHLPPIELTIRGEGDERAALETLLRMHNLPMVKLPGFTRDISGFLASQHLYLQPSRREGFCIAAHEAMQAGLGVIASAVGELPSSIENGVNGWTVPPENVEALAGQLAATLAHPEQLAAIGHAARARVLERFNAAKFQVIGDAVLARMIARETR